MDNNQLIQQEVEAAYRGFQSAIAFYLTDPEESSKYLAVLEALKASGSPASASSSNHGSFDGGLLLHSFRVCEVLNYLVAGLLQTGGDPTLLKDSFVWKIGALPTPLVKEQDGLSKQLFSLTPDSLLKVALLHDLNKLTDLRGRPYYVPNMIKNGTVRSTAKPWETSDKAAPLECFKEALQERAVPTDEWMDVLLDGEFSVRDGRVSLAVASMICPGIQSTLSEVEKYAIIYHDGAYVGRTGLSNEPILQILLHAADMIASRHIC